MSIVVSSSYISEPLDTLMNPSIISIEASTPPNGDVNYNVPTSNCTWTWTTNRTGILDVIIDASKNGAYDTLIIDFRKVTDIAGNPADTTTNGGFYIISTQ